MSTGDAGEARIQLYMESHGWQLIEGEIGARTRHFDLVFEKDGHVLVTQIKTSSEEDGRIRCQNQDPHKSAADLVQEAENRNGRAIMVLVHLSSAPVTVLATRDGVPVLETSLPDPKLITWAEPLDFATRVEQARDRYAEGVYQIGPQKGQQRPRTGLGYPAYVEDFPELASLLDGLATTTDAETASRDKIVRQNAVSPE